MSNVATRPDVIEVDAVVIGGGFAGLYTVHTLRDDLGLTVQAFDNASDVGGTWYWNRYPGARSDTEVNAYCYFFDQELYNEWKWTERYPRQSEILAYLNHVADRYDLRKSYQFSTQIESLIFDEETDRWFVSTDKGQLYSAQFLVEAVGLLSATNVPEFPGQENFRGEIYHTARWPHEPVDLAGKRVGVIGTGSSGIQVISEIAPIVGHLTVFQRTPQWVVPSRHRPIDPDLIESIRNDYEGYHHDLLYSTTAFGFPESAVSAESVDEAARREAFEKVYDDGGGFQYMFKAFNDVGTSLVANKSATDVIEKRIRETVNDPIVAELLVPTDLYAKRPLCCDDYYEAYNRATTTLVDVKQNPIVEFTEKGIRAGDTEYELDVIVLATGFDAVSGNQLRIFQQGRNGLTLQDKWRDRAYTYLGTMTAGFPNMYMVYGPMGPFTNQPPVHEAQVDWIADAIKHTVDSGAATLEPTQKAEDDWMELCDAGAAMTLFPRVNSWINGANIPGKPVVNYFFMGGMAAYMDFMNADRDSEFGEHFLTDGHPARVKA
ncbi:flavin-containing monooxygenase [Herbiconiux ginsengi]|uniref:Predicted flavoprotein CzcO associated with the cation diffusion facilitator CzcD n=1 Tax=Herbiconiux ginsengi TaxID=381665 RepID=A0A1H3NF35_9MICO|nr:NAD(P)/FAD-dependent oxidoreductase [Herbiconiux ginsengi]SDY86789.1 Predicted flavoprotein CzcO associated with the cation diffusion facilitator CzcD [Herbiconiux ginsengi]